MIDGLGCRRVEFRDELLWINFGLGENVHCWVLKHRSWHRNKARRSTPTAYCGRL